MRLVPQLKTITTRAARNIVALVGFATFVVGLAGYDWRLAAIVGGAIAFCLSIYGMTHAR